MTRKEAPDDIVWFILAISFQVSSQIASFWTWSNELNIPPHSLELSAMDLSAIALRTNYPWSKKT